MFPRRRKMGFCPVIFQQAVLIKKAGTRLEIQAEGQIVLGFFVKMTVLHAPGHVASDEIAEKGGPKPKSNAANDGLFQLGDADVEVAVGVVGSVK